MERRWSFGFPDGWFQLDWSDNLAPGGVMPLRYFDRDLVLYRGTSGEVHLLDAHCPHLGTHLGYGGTVADDDIVCPFDGWRWAPDGTLRATPSGDPPAGARIGTWSCREVNSAIFGWYSGNGSDPTWSVAALPEATDPSFYPCYPYGIHAETVGFPPQFFAENSVDLAHLKYVHRWADVPPTTDIRIDGPLFQNFINGIFVTPKGNRDVVVENQLWGLGIMYNRLAGLHPTVEMVNVTPIDHFTSRMHMSVWTGRAADDPDGIMPSGVAAAVIRAQINEVLGPDADRPIWENQIYVERPPLAREEAAAVREFRKWARTHYREPAMSAG